MKIVAMLALLGTGCSFIGVRGPPSPLPEGPAVECTDANGLPSLDLAVAMLGIPGGAGLYYTFHGDYVTEFIAVAGAAAMILGAVYLASGLTGYARVGACRRAQVRLAAKEIAARTERDRRHGDAMALTEHAVAAAAAGDCTTVRLIEPQVRALEARVHETVFLANGAIKLCLGPAPSTP